MSPDDEIKALEWHQNAMGKAARGIFPDNLNSAIYTAEEPWSDWTGRGVELLTALVQAYYSGPQHHIEKDYGKRVYEFAREMGICRDEHSVEPKGNDSYIEDVLGRISSTPKQLKEEETSKRWGPARSGALPPEPIVERIHEAYRGASLGDISEFAGMAASDRLPPHDQVEKGARLMLGAISALSSGNVAPDFCAAAVALGKNLGVLGKKNCVRTDAPPAEIFQALEEAMDPWARKMNTAFTKAGLETVIPNKVLKRRKGLAHKRLASEQGDMNNTPS